MVRSLSRLARVAVCIASIACSGADGVRDTATSGSTGAAAPPFTSLPAPPAASSVPPSVTTRIALDGAGLMLVDSSGSTRSIAFGMPEARVLTAVVAALGDPRDRSTNLDCGAGPVDVVSFPGGLLVNLQAGKFVGWTVRPARGREPRTMSGIGLGSTRAELASSARSRSGARPSISRSAVLRDLDVACAVRDQQIAQQRCLALAAR